MVERTGYYSERLELGRVYTRRQLKEQFSITDSTINNGVFSPAGGRSVWLFVTGRKTKDRTPYADRLEPTTLHWEGQTKRGTDRLLITHEAAGLEVLLFYRSRKYEFSAAGFRYYGPLTYLRHVTPVGEGPTRFEFRRTFDDLDVMVGADMAALDEERGYIEGGRRSLVIDRWERSRRLRATAVRIHGTRCQACDLNFGEMYGALGVGYIEVHHVIPGSSYMQDTVVDPVLDLVVLCANCHRMVHRRPRKPLTVSELRERIARGTSTTDRAGVS